MTRLRLRTLLLLGFALLFAASVGRAVWVAAAFRGIAGAYAELVARHDRDSAALARVSRLAIDLETGVRGWVITRDEQFLAPYEHALAESGPAFDELERLLQGRSELGIAAGRLRASLAAWDREIGRPMVAGPDGVDARLHLESKRRMDQIRASIAALSGSLDREEAANGATFEAQRQALSSRFFLAVGADLILIVALAIVLRRMVEVPITRLVDHAHRAGEGVLEPIAVGGVLEARTLAAAISAMIANLRAERAREAKFTALVTGLAEGGTVSQVAAAALGALRDEHQAVGAVLWMRPLQETEVELVVGASIAFDPATLQAGEPAARRVLESGESLELDLARERPDGSPTLRVLRTASVDVAPSHVCLMPIEAAGRPIGVLELAGAAAVEVGSLRRALSPVGLALGNARAADRAAALLADLAQRGAELRSVLDALTEAVFLFDRGGVCRLCNPAAVRLAGPSVGRTVEELRVALRARSVSGEPLSDAVVIDGDPTRGAQRGLERRILSADGVECVVSMTAIPVDAVDGAAGLVLSVRDVTEERQLRERLTVAIEEQRAQNEELLAQEEELRTQAHQLIDRQAALALRNEELQRVSGHKTTFLATMSHELRTPLNAIIGFTDLLLEDAAALSTEHRAWVADVHRAGNHLLMLINDLLDLSRIEAGKYELQLSDVDLRDAVQSAFALQSNAARAKGLRLALEGGDAPVLACADPNRVRQVLLNLVANAVKFTDAGSVTVRLETEGSSVRVSVADTGIGIAPRDEKKLFRAFSQLDTGHGRHYEGTGLGLAICKQLVEAMQGTIGVESAPGAGSTFWFTVPKGRTSQPAAAATPSVSAKPSQPPPALDAPRMTVLLVEDLESDARIIEASLTRANCDVRWATSAEDALRMLDSVSPAVVIIDLGLPGMSGRRLVEELRASRHRRLPIVVLTARDLTGEERKALEAEVQHVAQKGVVSRADFVDRLREAAAAEVRPRTESLPSRPLRVLVVDDNDLNRRVVVRILAQLTPCVVVEAENGPMALERAREQALDVVLMDIQMPGMDGLEVVRQLREDPRTRALPVIAVTAHAMEGDADRFLAAGCVAYVSKPIARARLAAALGLAVDRAVASDS